MRGVHRIRRGRTVPAVRMCIRVRLRGRNHLHHGVRTACAMAGAGQRSPHGKQHGKQHQQQDSNGFHEEGRLARAGRSLLPAGRSDAADDPLA